MQLLLYEYITGGGMWGAQPGEPPGGSLLTEGSAMIRALAADFCALPVCEVHALRDARLASFDLPMVKFHSIHSALEELDTLRNLAAQVDFTMLIAPEGNNELLRRAELVLEVGGRLLSPSPEFIALAADKHAAAECLLARGVPAPSGVLLEAGESLPVDFPYPAVLKPRDGCGSQDVRLITSHGDYFAGKWADAKAKPASWRLERYYHGQPASIAALTGPAGNYLLPACSQRLSDDGRFTYLGGQTPLSAELSCRARRLATAALAALPPAVGYVGFDLVLGNDDAGSQDVVIEVNPRLTTSYVGLRKLTRRNLAAAMLAAGCGYSRLSLRESTFFRGAKGDIPTGNAVELSFGAGPIEFEVNGDLV